LATVKILLRKNYRKKDGTYPLAIRITKDRKTRFIFTGEYLDEKYWNEKSGLVKKSHPNSTRLNNLLLKKRSEAHNILLDVQTNGAEESIKTIKKKIQNKNVQDFFVVAHSHLNKLLNKKKFNQHSAENGRIEVFKTFLKKESLNFKDLDVSLLNKLENYLLYERKTSPRTVVNYFILIRTIFNLGITQYDVDRKLYPFGKGKIQIKIPESEKIGLTKEEILLLEEATDLTPAQEHAVKVWLFSFYFAGVRVADVLKTRWSDFKDGRLYYRMGKNQKLVSLKIPDKAQKILDHYKTKKSKKNDLIFPDLKDVNFDDVKKLNTRVKTINRNLNRRLAIVADKLEIDKKLSMHIARHSFGNISGDQIPIQMLQKLYRHSSITTTINYQQNFMHKETDEALDSVVNF
jgi:integrase